jgi:DNA-binding GntR family transcriptional regulator
VIDRPVLRDRVKDLLLERIASGALPPGSRIVETRIAQELGTSQAPVREALRDLEQLGLVVHEPYRGCSVRAPSASELMEAFPVRAALESLAARLAAPRIGAEEVERLDALVEVMLDAAASGDALAQSHANAEFHATIVSAAGNATLARQWSLLEPFARTYLTVTRSHVDLAALAARHAPIVVALRARDGDAAALAMETHLAEASRLLADAPEEEHAA